MAMAHSVLNPLLYCLFNNNLTVAKIKRKLLCQPEPEYLKKRASSMADVEYSFYSSRRRSTLPALFYLNRAKKMSNDNEMVLLAMKERATSKNSAEKSKDNSLV